MKKILITLISVAVAIVAMAAGSKLWVHSHSGNHLSIDIADLDSIGFTNDGSGIFNIKDVCGNTYKCVTIGSQVWMAENMRCYKYDTQSERAGATLSTSSRSTYAPYYTDASDKSLWNSNSQEYGANLTSEQIGKLGYLYNWAAAVGIATAEDAEAQTSKFSTNRQGICPNGWHVPTSAEWNTLKDYLGSNAGKKLKSTSGWYNGGNGTDEYSFAALPAGRAYGSSVNYVGSYADFWSATPYNSNFADLRGLSCSSDNLGSTNFNKDYAQSVRCVKNIPVQSVSLSKSSHNFQTIGESVQLTATVLPSDASNPNVTWKSSDSSVATVSNDGLVTCTGFGEATITATSDGVSATCKISAIIVIESGSVSDVCGNTYKTVKIGTQWWMAENMRCNKYDTQSERAGATLSTSSSSTYAPYYTDGRNATTSSSGSLTSEQRNKLGYLYNWAAAVGLATESDAKNQTSSFSGNRQGICPNGWHVPTSAEWNTLENYVGSNAGTKLKATSGWYYGNGTDDYSFAALPAGSANGSKVYDVGGGARIWTATPPNNDVAYDVAYIRILYFSRDYLTSSGYGKIYAQSVRCIRN